MEHRVRFHTGTQRRVPGFFARLVSLGCAAPGEMLGTEDGFWLCRVSLCDLLAVRGIRSLADGEGNRYPCPYFFDDWYLYALPEGEGWVFGLLKLREQEDDRLSGIEADGDSPGVTVSFIRFRERLLLEGDGEDGILYSEIRRVVSQKGQDHDPTMKAYFSRAEAKGPYLIGDTYVKLIAAKSVKGILPVPRRYRELTGKGKRDRLLRAIEELNRQAGRTVCDNRFIFFRDPKDPDIWEKNAVLTTHTANTSLFSFAAEICFHACFLVGLAKLTVPGIGASVYDSAVRADMTVDERTNAPALPFHDPKSSWVRRQVKYHGLSLNRDL